MHVSRDLPGARDGHATVSAVLRIQPCEVAFIQYPHPCHTTQADKLKMGFLDDLEVDMVNSCDLRSLFRSSLAHFPPQDQQHAIQYDLLLSLLNLLAATTSDPGHQRPPSSPRSLSIDDMDDDELFFHVLHQELTSVNRHFEECAAGIVAQWASHGEGSLESPPLAESSSANDAPASTQEQYVRRVCCLI